MKTSDFYYDLPQELIAQYPIKDRASSRLLVLNQQSGNIEHKIFTDIISYIKKDDCLVLNNTRVLPARLFGTKKGTDSKVEILLLKEIKTDIWEILIKPGKKGKIGNEIDFSDELSGEILDIDEQGNRIIHFKYSGNFYQQLDKIGQMPLPHYIKPQLEDNERYQTVYNKEIGSVAAPTAGLHFTQSLLERIKNNGTQIATTTLHVGLGTFRPVKVGNINEHIMHKEVYHMKKSEAEKINNCKGNIIAVGTTSCRVLETLGNEQGKIIFDEEERSGETGIFIYPGYKFKIVDKLITNFHLPESTLLMLISALAGQEQIKKAYSEAIEQKYRFFSFGDSMMID